MSATTPLISPPDEEGYFKALFHAVPCPVLIVDDDVRIMDYNNAAAGMVGPNRRHQYMKRAGEVVHCVHADAVPDGCGHSEHCRECIVRKSVGEVFRDGKTLRRKTRMTWRSGHGDVMTEVDLSLTAAPFSHGGRPLVLLVLEDLSELMLLRRMVPICSHCKKIRNDRDYWESVEEYFIRRTAFEFTHSICDACMEEHYKGIVPGKPKG